MANWEEKLKIYASDTRTSEELLEAHRREREMDIDPWEIMPILHYRGGQTEFDIARRLAESEDSEDRSIAADILGQLGWKKEAFQKESVDILIDLLNDENPDVIYCAAIALGHRRDPKAVEPLAKLLSHPDPDVRHAVAFGLLTHEDDHAIDALIILARDVDHDVRNWAMFGLGTQIEKDTPEIREALINGLNDEDDEIRGEALVGLANRNDPRVLNALLKEWENEYIGILSLEAAETLGDPLLLPRLNEFLSTFELDDDHYKSVLLKAIKACQPKKNGSNNKEIKR